MPRNVEIKAKVDNLQAVLEKARLLSENQPVLIKQKDVFFHSTNGRLKLRFLSPEHGELIFYNRGDIAGPKTSSYQITKTDQPAKLRKTLALAYGEKTIVKKNRTLIMVGRTRIHLDDVKNLGTYVELEVVLSDEETSSSGEKEARDLMIKLGIPENTLIEIAYADLLEQVR
ncbi:MAG: class IV adenylate cyclase [Hyphomicrobiales bacterium]|nr:class IV adenylate cyclase [Hyphomicrobiales bacterium]